MRITRKHWASFNSRLFISPPSSEVNSDADTSTEEQDMVFVIGNDPLLPEGLELAVKSMYKGEISEFDMLPSLWEVKEDVPLKTDEKRSEVAVGIDEAEQTKDVVCLRLELVSFIKGVESWQLSQADRLGLMRKRKEQGSAYFNHNRVLLAEKKYSQALSVFQWDAHLQELKKEVDLLRAQCFSNMAACRLYMKDYPAVITASSKALQFEAKHSKSLLRRGRARLALHQNDLAFADLSFCNSLGELNCTSLLAVAQKRLKLQTVQEQHMYEVLFSSPQVPNMSSVHQSTSKKTSERQQADSDTFDHLQRITVHDVTSVDAQKNISCAVSICDDASNTKPSHCERNKLFALEENLVRAAVERAVDMALAAPAHGV